MQIVIDIPNDYYRECIEKIENGDCDYNITKWIANGKILPKGHGRLIDADVIWNIYHDNDYDFYDAINDVPTVLEADKESAE